MRQIMLEDTTVERLPEVLSSLRMDLAQREEEAKVIILVNNSSQG